MRAKEKLEFNKAEFEFYMLVKKSIYDLYPLRTNKRKTEEYCDNHLFADARCREIFKINNCNHESVNFHENDDEIDHLISYRVRKEIQNAICDDKTFIYAYNIIERDHNPYNDVYKSKSLQLKPETLTSAREIEEEISSYKEDYPKNNLSDYLIDEANFKFYNERFLNLNFDDEGWLFIFNKAYEIFDRIRTFAANPSQAHHIANNIYFGDKLMEDAILDFLLLLIDNYSYDLTPVQVKKFRLLAFFISKHRDPQTLTIEKKYLERIHSLNLAKVDWMKATRYFNVHLISNWVTYSGLSYDQQLQILNLIKGNYITEKQRNPDFFCYDLSDCFSQLQQLLTSDEPPPGCNGSPAPSTNTINPNPPKNQLPMVQRCSSIARLVHKTCVQGQASGLKKISTFWRSACGSSPSKGSIFFATLAHTAATLSSCAPTLSLRFVWCSSLRGCLFCCTTLAQSSRVATLAPSNPNKVFASLMYLLKGATATQCFCSPAGRSC